jgi:acyl-CoA thioester hydrolase
VQQVSKEHWQKLSRPEWDANYIWVVRSHHITYQRSALLGEQLEIRTFVKEARGAQSERHVLITQGDRETPVVSCKTIWVLLDARSGKPVRLPDSMLKVFE